MGTNVSNENQTTLRKAYSASDQYLSFYQLQSLTPPLVKTLSFRRPYQNVIKQHHKKAKKIKLEQGLYIGHINQNEKPYGIGKLYHENGSLVIGKFQDGSVVGQYHAFQADGSYFCGSAIDKNQKQGTISYADGTLQQGHFSNGLLEGLGSEKTLKYTFEGQFKQGKPTKGKLRWYKQNQTHTYQGSFDENGHFIGEGKNLSYPGKLVEPNGTYTGQFKNGLKDGPGKYQFENGLLYEGQYSQGVKQGQGTLYNPDHSLCYEGHFEKNLPNGKGAAPNTKGRKIQTQYFQGLSRRQLDLIQTMASIDNGEI